MSDMKIRPIKIKLDKERNLLFDLNAFEVLEEIYGELDAAFTSFQDKTKLVKNIKNFLYAGLVYEDTELTPKSIGTFIGHTNIYEISNTIWDAISQNLPDAEEGSESNQGE
jgi:hypothetical protein